MPSALTIFAAGIGTVALALGVGFAGSHFLYSAKAPTQKALSADPVAPPPTVEKIERKHEPIVAEAVEPAPPTPTKSETTGSGGGWVTEVPRAAEPKPATPTIPYLAPVATAVAPPPATAATAPPTTAAPTQEPVTAGMRPSGVQPPVMLEATTAKTETPQVIPDKPQRSGATKKDKKRERTIRRREDTERDVTVERERNRKRPVLVERRRERLDADDQPRRRRTVVTEERRLGREVITEEPQRGGGADFFSILFGSRN